MTAAAQIARRLDENAEEVATRLLGESSSRNGRELRFGRKGSLSIVIAGDRRGRWYDHGAAEGGDMLEFVRREHSGDMRAALDWSRRFLGEPIPWQAARPTTRAMSAAPPLRTEPQRWSEKAQAIWEAARPLHATAADTYIGHRIGEEWPTIRDRVIDGDALRFLPARGDRTAAMVAKVTDARTAAPMSLHFTRLQQDGSGKANDGRPPKLLLSGHAKAGGVVRLSADDEVTYGLGIVEGIETGLAVMASGFAPVWVCVDAGNISAFPVLSWIESLSIFADHDPAGLKAAENCAQRWLMAKREVAVVVPPRSSTDWADGRAA